MSSGLSLQEEFPEQANTLQRWPSNGAAPLGRWAMRKHCHWTAVRDSGGALDCVSQLLRALSSKLKG